MDLNTSQPIYVVDDDEALTEMLCMFLENNGYSNVKGYLNGEEFLNEADKKQRIIVIQDFDLPGMNGIDVIKKASTELNNADFIFLSGQHSIDVAVDAIKYGAFDYIIKDSFAKENCLNKIRNLQKVRALYKAKTIFKTGFIILAVLFVLSWILLYVFGVIEI